MAPHPGFPGRTGGLGAWHGPPVGASITAEASRIVLGLLLIVFAPGARPAAGGYEVTAEERSTPWPST